MEILKLTYILLKESVRSLWKGFDGESFWQQCIQVNVLYTKFFQALSGKYLFSSVHTIPYTSDEFEPTYPVKKVIGSGLISIVYESELENKPIVVKTKRKNIDQHIHSSIQSLQWYLDWIHWFYPIPTLFLAFEEIKQSFLTQLDYLQEVKNHKHFQSIANYPFIQTPILHENECNETQIVMTKMEHKPISMLTKEEVQKSICHLTEMVLHLLTHHGFIHGDLHLGNLLFQENSLGIIDFGFIVQLTNDQREHMFELVKGLILHDYESSAIHTLSFMKYTSLSSDEEMDIKQFIIHVYQKAMEIQHSFSVYNFYELNTKLSTYNMSFDPLFYKIIMALHSVETLITQITNPDELALQLAVLLCVHDNKSE